MFSCKIRKISKNTLFYRTYLAAASEIPKTKSIYYKCFDIANWIAAYIENKYLVKNELFSIQHPCDK